MQFLDIKKLKCILIFGLMLLSWTCQTHENFAGSGDEPHFLMIAHSIFFDRDLELSNNFNDNGNPIQNGTLVLDKHTPANAKGQHYSSHQIGMPLLLAPYYGLSVLTAQKITQTVSPSILKKLKLDTWQLIKFFMGFMTSFLTGLLGVQIFDLVLYFSKSIKTAFIGAALTIATVPIFSYSFLFYTETLNALIALWIIKHLVMDQKISAARYALLGTVLGYSFFIHLRNIGFIVPLTFLISWQLFKEYRQTFTIKSAIHFYVPLIFLLISKVIFNLAIWNIFLTDPNNHVRAFSVIEIIRTILFRMAAQWLDQEHGLLLYAPLYVWIFPAIIYGFKQFTRLTTILTLCSICYWLLVLCPVTNQATWSGDWSPAGRLLIMMLPLWSILIILFLSSFKKLPYFFWFLALWQVAMSTVFWQNPKLFWNSGTGQAKILSFANLSYYWPSYWNYSGRTVYISYSIVVILVLAFYFTFHTKKPSLPI